MRLGLHEPQTLKYLVIKETAKTKRRIPRRLSQITFPPPNSSSDHRKQARKQDDLPKSPKIQTSPGESRHEDSRKRASAHQIGACGHLLFLRAENRGLIRKRRQQAEEMPPCPAAGPLSELKHGWITRPDGRPGTPMRCLGCGAPPAGAREGESYEHLPNPRATRHQRRRRRRRRPAPGRWPPFRRSPTSPRSAPLWCARRSSSPEARWLRRGVPARWWWVVRRSRDAGLRDRGTTTTYPNAGGETGGHTFYTAPRGDAR